MSERLFQSVMFQESGGLRVAGRSRASEYNRGRNEDAMLYVPEAQLAIVMDGSSGSLGGRAASREGALYLADRLGTRKSTSVASTVREIRRALLDCSPHIEETTGARTTAVLVKLVDTKNGRDAVFGNLGDSRGYHFANDSLTRITRDHSLLHATTISQAKKDAADERMDRVATFEELALLKEIDPVAWRLICQRNWVVQILGEQQSLYPSNDRSNIKLKKDMKLSPRTNVVTLERENKILLTSDGVHDNLTIDHMEFILASSLSNNLATAIVARAYKASQDYTPRSEQDDMTAVVLSVR